MAPQRQRLIELINNFHTARVLIIGDIILDKYAYGNASRLSPEAPVLIIKMTKETCVPGGAANSAHNIATLGGSAHVIGLIGNDDAGGTMKELLHEKKVNIEGLVTDNSRSTIVKTRVVAQNQQLLRIDREEDHTISTDEEEKIISSFKKSVGSADVVLISDYNKGLMTLAVARAIITECGRLGKKVIVDTKQNDTSLYKGAYLITPNLKEASDIAKIEPRSDEKIREIGNILTSMFSAHILITRGKEGMTLFKDEKIEHLPTKAQEVFDVSGAGDTVASVIALTLAARGSLEEAMILANHAAGIVVGKFGTATTSPEELISALGDEL